MGQVKHSLPVINDGMQKTANQHFGDPYFLYGPTEKRICPKLRGKNVGDVVSEYVCRHHCLDGIVIDDNKTVCGEALWRANVMDKFSRDYVDEDGNITGGYVEKRFEVHHDVPEENKMRLKPGEIRKPRPASWGSLESRMQAMRNKEGKKRGYRPDTNTGEPFNWAKDVDQNNVEVASAERERREKASGHQTVQYIDKNEQENKPKVAFNLKQIKTATWPGENSEWKKELDQWHAENIDDVGRYIGPDLTEFGFSYKPGEFIPVDKRYSAMSDWKSSMRSKTNTEATENEDHASAFNLKRSQYKSLPMGDLSYDGLSDGGEAYTDEELELDKEQQGPDPSDVVFEDHGGPFYSDGKCVAQNVKELKDWLLKSNMYPDFWFISDHGNQHLSSIEQVIGMPWKLLELQRKQPKPMPGAVSSVTASNDCEGCKRSNADSGQAFNLKRAKSPPGWSGTIERMKEHDEIDNPFALAWHQYNKGDKPHYKTDGTPKDTEEATTKKKITHNKTSASSGISNTLERNFERGKRLIDPNQGPQELIRTIGDILKYPEQYKTKKKDPRYLFQRPGKPSTGAPSVGTAPTSPSAKPLLMECCEHDEDRADSLFESLSDKELSIIQHSNDPKLLIKIRDSVEHDLNETAKDLAMDD